ncbi:hypothetical protein Tco_1427061 [Tanacetum coccineum]
MPLLPYPPSSPTDATTISITTTIAVATIRVRGFCSAKHKGAFGVVLSSRVRVVLLIHRKGAFGFKPPAGCIGFRVTARGALVDCNTSRRSSAVLTARLWGAFGLMLTAAGAFGWLEAR